MEPPVLLQRAMLLAKANPAPQWKLGAVLARGKKTLAYGMNSERNDVKIVAFTECGVHAEMAALRQVSAPAKTTMYVARIGRDERWRMARPCRRCWGSLVDSGVKSVWYTTTDGFAHEWITGGRALQRD